mmetsp:Transcript_7229/g.17599  ORF Transcript_7229/g.17599 Transcript_7229/m.17599 type:complete len:184 (+) Transcript_7229:666-1217(+)
MFFPSYNLELKSSERQKLGGTWTLQHEIIKGNENEDGSPLWGMSCENLRESRSHFFLSVTGVDDATEESVTIIEYYRSDDVLYGYKFQDQVSVTNGPDGSITAISLDFSKLSAVEPAIVSYPIWSETKTPTNNNQNTDSNSEKATIGQTFNAKAPLLSSVNVEERSKYGSTESSQNTLKDTKK